jgi:hypothetical protein
MVPDIDTFSAAVHAVFDQHKRSDPRYIPFEIGDIKDRSVNPLLVAMEWLLRLPQQRCRQSEVRDLLDVPALAARFGLDEDDLPTLGRWIEGASVRWGLDQRTAPAWAWARPASRIPGCSGSGACCWAMPPAPAPASATSNRMRKSAGWMRPGRRAGRTGRSLLAWRDSWTRCARRPSGASAPAPDGALLPRRDDEDRMMLNQLERSAASAGSRSARTRCSTSRCRWA